MQLPRSKTPASLLPETSFWKKVTLAELQDSNPVLWPSLMRCRLINTFPIVLPTHTPQPCDSTTSLSSSTFTDAPSKSAIPHRLWRNRVLCLMIGHPPS